MAFRRSSSSPRRRRRHYDCPWATGKNCVLPGKGCDFEGARKVKELRQHLRECPFIAEEVGQIAQLQAAYFCNHSVCAPAAAALVREMVKRLQLGELDEVQEYVPGEGVVAVQGFRTEPLRDKLGSAIGSQLSELDPTWTGFLHFCLPGFHAVSVPYAAGEYEVPGLIVAGLRDDVCDDNGARTGEHSYLVWNMALQAAMQMYRAPAGGARLREALSIHGSKLEAEERVLGLFEDADVDGDGTLSKNEFAAIFRSLDSKFSNAVIAAMFDSVDASDDDEVQYAEFIAWLFR